MFIIYCILHIETRQLFFIFFLGGGGAIGIFKCVFFFEEDNTKKSIDIVKMPPNCLQLQFIFCTIFSVQCMSTVAYLFYLQSHANCEGFLKLLQ